MPLFCTLNAILTCYRHVTNHDVCFRQGREGTTAYIKQGGAREPELAGYWLRVCVLTQESKSLTKDIPRSLNRRG
jgi:hypothetical protein